MANLQKNREKNANSSWESTGHKWPTTSDLKPYLSSGAVISVEQETIKTMRTRALEVIIEWNLVKFTRE